MYMFCWICSASFVCPCGEPLAPRKGVSKGNTGALNQYLQSNEDIDEMTEMDSGMARVEYGPGHNRAGPGHTNFVPWPGPARFFRT